MIELLNENLSKDIHAAVRKVAKQMESQTNIRRQPMKNRFASGFNVEADVHSINNSDSMVTLEGQNKQSKMEALLTTPQGSTALIERSSQK